MANPNVSLSMRTEGKLEKGDFEPSVGAGFEIEYDPLKTKLSFDYSSEDSLGLKLEGEYRLKVLGQDVRASAGVSFGKDTWKTGESLVVGISKSVAATISHELSSKGGNAFVGSVKVSF